MIFFMTITNRFSNFTTWNYVFLQEADMKCIDCSQELSLDQNR